MPDAIYVHDAFARIADRYVLTNHVLSCGMDIWWRKVVTARIRKWKPARLLDVASGTGDLALEIQDECPQCEVIASDFCAEMLAHAASRGIAKTIVADALQLPFKNAEFDVVTVAFGLRNMADYPAALREMHRVLKPGGRLVILDFSLPDGILRGPYRWYLHHVLPHMAGWLTGQKDAATQFLKRTTSTQLVTAFSPIMQKSLDQVGATRYYTQMASSYNQLDRKSVV